MKKFSFLLICSLITTGIFAQDALKDTKLMVFKKDWPKAKDAIDKVLADAKNAGNAEAWYYKGAIYNIYSKEGNCPNCRMDAFEAIKKYQELDPKNAQMEPNQNAELFDLYNGLFDAGSNNFNAKNYDSAIIYYKQTLQVQEYIASKGFIINNFKMPVLDTSLVLNIGLAAYNAKKNDEAAVYFKKLVDNNVSAANYENSYEILAEYYVDKKDAKTLSEITAKASKFYPDRDDYWALSEVDVTDKSNKTELLAKYEEVTAKYPNNYLVNYNYSTELYNNIYGGDVKDPNHESNKPKLVALVKRTIALDKEISATVLLARHYYNDAYEKNDEAVAIKGTKPEDVKKRTELNNTFKARMAEAIPYAETAVKFYNGLEKLKGSQKTNYRLMLILLKDAYAVKGDAAKSAEYKAKVDVFDKQ